MPQDQTAPLYPYSSRQTVLGLIAVFAVFGTMSYFIQTTNIARPRMAADLDGMSLYSYAISIPGLAAAFVTLIFGKFSDMYGRRLMLLVSLWFFLAGSILSAVSTSFISLIAQHTLGHFRPFRADLGRMVCGQSELALPLLDRGRPSRSLPLSGFERRAFAGQKGRA